MSINALTNAAIARRPDFEPHNEIPRNLTDIAMAAGAPPRPIADSAAPPPAEGSVPPGTGPNTALQTLTTYIPTEVITLYVSAVAALGTKKPDDPRRWLPFICFLIITPLVVWIAFATKVRAGGKPLPVSPLKWPVWEMTAATIAYIAWTFALPNTPFEKFENWYSAGIAGFLVLIVSWGLGAIAPLMQRSLVP